MLRQVINKTWSPFDVVRWSEGWIHGRDSSAGIATSYRLDGLGSIFRYEYFQVFVRSVFLCITFGPKRGEVTEEWRKLHNKELHDLYTSPSIIRVIKSRRMRWAGHIARMGEKVNAYRLLVGKPAGRRPLGRRRRRWLDNIRMNLIELGWGDVDWIGLAQDRDRWRALANLVLYLRVS
jgi:hypothetical protein